MIYWGKNKRGVYFFTMVIWMKAALRIIGLTGLVIFCLMCSVTFLSPITFERAAKSLIQRQVESKVRKSLDSFDGSLLEKVSRHLSTQNEAEISEIRKSLNDRLPEKIASLIGEMQDLRCDCRKKLAESIRKSFQLRISALEDAQPQLKALVQNKYVAVVNSLLLDLRIFSGINSLVFLFLLAVSLMKPVAMAQLFLPGALLLVATLVSAYFYLFNQNWFYTIVYNDYVGWAYLSYIAIVFLFLCDVVFNRARVTTGIINQFLSAIGHSASLAPC